MIDATTISGQPAPVPNTPSAASITATLPIMSLRVHSHTERMFASPFLNAYSNAATAPLAANASTLTTPMVCACGTWPPVPSHTARASTSRPKAPITRPLAYAARERHTTARPSTNSETP